MKRQTSLSVMAGIATVLAFGGCASVEERRNARFHADELRTTYGSATALREQTDVPFPRDSATFEDCVQAAFKHNPAMKAAFNRWQAALQRIRWDRSLDDPFVTLEYFADQIDIRHQFTLQQSVPWFGKILLKEKIDVADADTAMHEFNAARIMVYSEVANAFNEYAYLGQAIKITEENIELVSELEKSVQARHGAGSATFSETVKIEIEGDRLRNELAAMQDERGAASARLAAAVGLTTDKALPWPAPQEHSPALINEQALRSMLRDLNPDLKSKDVMIEKTEYEVKLAAQNYLPDFMIGAAYMVMPGTAGDERDASIMVGLTIPLWIGKNASAVREARAMRSAAENERDAMENSLNTDLRMAIFKLRDAERKIALFRNSLVVKARQAVEVARQEFSSGKGELMSLIDAERTHLEFSLLLARAYADREIAMAEIGCCVGKYDIGNSSKDERK